MAFAGNFYERQREQDLIQRMKRDNGFDCPRPFKSLGNDELDSFAGVFIPWGHAPLRDLSSDQELGRILKHFHSKGKPTAVICHGLIALLSTKCAWDGEDGGFAYKCYKLTSFSDAEEKAVETLMGGEINPKVESSLKSSGAVMIEGAREKVGYITVDKEVVSGGNPMAAQDLGRQFVSMLTGAA
jgi:putative intracellular protease/amidase